MKQWLGAALAATIVLTQAASASAQSEPDRLLRLNMGFGDAEYYFCSATSRDAPRAIQVITEVVTTDARVTLYQMLAGIEAVANPLPGRPWRDVSCHENSGGGSNTFQTREAAEDYRGQWITAARAEGTTIVELPWPGTFGRDDKRNIATDKRKADGLAQANSLPTAPPVPANSKYVEVAGPDGPIRLSPEVAARNQAAADAYRRRMEEHDRAMAAHEQRLAQHRQNAATAASPWNSMIESLPPPQNASPRTGWRWPSMRKK